MWFWWFMLQNSPFNEKYGYMEKRIHMLALVLIVGICTGCGKENTGIENSPVKEQTASTSSENDELESNEELRRDLSRSVFAKQCVILIDKQQKERYNNIVIDNSIIV